MLEKDKVIKQLTNQAKQGQISLQISNAQAAEKESAIDELKEVIIHKDQLVVDLQLQMAKLMERLSTAEQKLFELQDTYTDDSKS